MPEVISSTQAMIGKRKATAPTREARKRSISRPVARRPMIEKMPMSEATPAAAMRSVPCSVRIGMKWTTSAMMVKVKNRQAMNNR